MVRDALRVLVVVDDLPICKVLELAFADEGWDVQVRSRSQDALDLLRCWMADVILLDAMLCTAVVRCCPIDGMRGASRSAQVWR